MVAWIKVARSPKIGPNRAKRSVSLSVSIDETNTVLFEEMAGEGLEEDIDLLMIGEETNMHPTMSSSRARHFVAEYFLFNMKVLNPAVAKILSCITTVNMGAPILLIA